MAAIDPRHLDVTVFLYPSRSAAEQGLDYGGTGFLVGLLPASLDPASHSNAFHVYAITNAHVIEQNCCVIRECDNGRMSIFETNRDNWTISSDDDLAAVRLDSDAARTNYLPSDFFVKEDCRIGEWQLYPGDEVQFFSRFVGHDGRQRNQALLRTGTLAMLPDKDAKVRVHGRDQLAFLVECRSLSGSSGSPAFGRLMQPRFGHYANQNPLPKDKWIPYDRVLLGCNCAHIPFWTQVRGAKSHDAPRLPHNFVETNSGVAVVVPAWKILELLHLPQLALERAEMESGERREALE